MNAEKSRAKWREITGKCLVTLAVATALGACSSLPKQPGKSSLSEEFEKQEKIYHSRGTSVPSGYITTRSIKVYAEVLPAGFMGALSKLGPSDRWLDIGAGGGQAILDYLAPEQGGKARAVGISIEDRRSDEWRQRALGAGGDRMQYLYGKYLREYSRQELGRFQVITDVFGGFSYTDDLSRFMEKVLSLLEINGNFYTLVQSVHLENGKDDPRTWYLTELADAAGRDVTVCAWLKSIACAQVTCDSKNDWDTPTELITVQKTCDGPAVPPLKLLQYEAGNPPGRRFQLVP